MNIPVVTLAAFMAICPLSSVASDPCTLNGLEVPGDPELIEGTGSADIIDCSASSIPHEIYGYGGGDEIYGSPFEDFIAGGSGKDLIYGGDGHDAIDGGGDDDEIHGEGGNDVIFGGVGSSPASGVGCVLQTAFVTTGSSYLTKGGSGDDLIYGGDGDDCINAGSGEDVVYGGDGNDTLVGGNHSDLLDGGLDQDYIDGGWHTDTCVDSRDDDEYVNCELYVDSAPFCGDLTCDTGEDSCSCPGDCDAPLADETLYCTDSMDNDCDGEIDCDDTDCSGHPSCSSTSECNNDYICDPEEDCNNCPNDCAGKSNGKPSGRYCCGDGTVQSAEENSSMCGGNF